MSRQLCKTHPDVDYKTAWGCPDCVRELRYENKKMKEILDRIYRAALISNEANPINRQWLVDNAKRML